MKFATKLSCVILVSGIAALSVFALIVFKVSSDTVNKSQFKYTKAIVTQKADDIDRILYEKVKIALTLANAPIIIKALAKSNISYADLPDGKRDESIKFLNKKWKSIINPEDAFILKFTDNQISLFLKKQQALFPDEYGEIFLTNQFGALVASTAKLSTFAHGHKYWWISAYNRGEGTVFFDDRGYDDSVKGYVLGIVVPVKKGSQVIGILKFNFNILGIVSQLISTSKDKYTGEFKLSRSGGTIIFEEGSEPLSTQLSAPVIKNIKEKKNNPFMINDSKGRYLVGLTEIKITNGKKGYAFGGTLESIDHQKGNLGESWYVLNYRSIDQLQTPVLTLIKWIVLVCLILIIFLVLIAYIFGQKMAEPLKILTKATEKIKAENFEYTINIKQDDEFGELANSFNNMLSRLQHTTTSIELLKDEIEAHKKSKAIITQNRLFLESSLESSKDMIILSLDKNYRYYFFNNTHAESMKHVFGIQPEIGDCIFDFMQGKDDIKKVKDHYDRALAGENHIAIEAYGQDHLRYYYEIQYNPMYNLENEIIGVTSFAQDITERKNAQEKIKASLKEKEILLSEIHHRVKNNMQVIISLLRLQSGKTRDKQYVDLFKNNERRVLSMALVHEQLYQSDNFTNIDFKEYIKNLTNDLFILHGVDANAVELIVECSDIFLDLDNAVPCGLIVNELVSNCLKHAFPDGRKGKIIVSVISLNKNEFELSISDDGAGIPKELDIHNIDSMGLHLVRVLVEDTFEGKVALERTKGTRFNLKLKKVKYKQRI